jgi:hypothetical protein
MQEHNYVLNFFRDKLVSIENTKHSYPEPLQEGEEFKQAKSELNEFMSNLKSHFVEEQVVFSFGVKS